MSKRAGGAFFLIVAVMGVSLASIVGCHEPGSSRDGDNIQQPVAAAEARSDVLKTAIETLRSDRVDSDRMLEQSAARLNQWLTSQTASGDWQPDPLIGTLPPGLRDELAASLAPLKPARPDLDLAYIQEAIWLQEISNQQRGGHPPELILAQRLFDWTVRNVQLEFERGADEPATTPGRSTRFWPWEVVMEGRGSALQRAWVFLLLARQQGLPVVMLARPNADGSLRPWLPALFHEGELYLFDPALGLPVPAAQEEGLPKVSQLPVNPGEAIAFKDDGPPFRVATLNELLADEQLARKLDVSADETYPADPQGAKEFVALIEASPFSLSRRMGLVSQLASEQGLALTVSPSRLAEDVSKCQHIKEVRLWSLPFEVFSLRTGNEALEQAVAREIAPYKIGLPLRRARVLHIRGQLEGDEGAKRFYVQTRSEVEKERVKLQGAPGEPLDRLKETATYWLGLATFAEADYKTAVQHLGRRTLIPSQHGPWSGGARYNLARAYEELGEFDKAIELYEADDSAQQHGNKIRARRLRALHAVKA